MTYDPRDLVGDVGFQHGRRHLPVPVRGEPVADVVEEGGDDILFALTGPGCPGCGLEGVLVAGHLVAVKRISLLLEVLQEPVGEPRDVVQLHSPEELVVLACPVLHPREANCLHQTPPFPELTCNAAGAPHGSLTSVSPTHGGHHRLPRRRHHLLPGWR